MKKIVKITENQKIKLIDLWFVYGNNGKKSTHGNHRFIQDMITYNEDNRKFFSNSRDKQNNLTQECIDEVDKILNEK